jgi:hypothetical protein
MIIDNPNIAEDLKQLSLNLHVLLHEDIYTGLELPQRHLNCFFFW